MHSSQDMPVEFCALHAPGSPGAGDGEGRRQVAMAMVLLVVRVMEVAMVMTMVVVLVTVLVMVEAVDLVKALLRVTAGPPAVAHCCHTT